MIRAILFGTCQLIVQHNIIILKPRIKINTQFCCACTVLPSVPFRAFPCHSHTTQAWMGTLVCRDRMDHGQCCSHRMGIPQAWTGRNHSEPAIKKIIIGDSFLLIFCVIMVTARKAAKNDPNPQFWWKSLSLHYFICYLQKPELFFPGTPIDTVAALYSQTEILLLPCKCPVSKALFTEVNKRS